MEQTTEQPAYHSRYALRSGQTIFAIRFRQCRKTFCDRYGTAFYDLKTFNAGLPLVFLIHSKPQGKWLTEAGLKTTWRTPV